jgi:hypothetical protein
MLSCGMNSTQYRIQRWALVNRLWNSVFKIGRNFLGADCMTVWGEKKLLCLFYKNMASFCVWSTSQGFKCWFKYPVARSTGAVMTTLRVIFRNYFFFRQMHSYLRNYSSQDHETFAAYLDSIWKAIRIFWRNQINKQWIYVGLFLCVKYAEKYRVQEKL